MRTHLISTTLTVLLTLSLVACDRSEQEEKPPLLLPWKIEVLPGGSTRVFDLVMELSNVKDAARIFGRRYELGLFENKDKLLTLEAYFSEVTLSGLSAKVILTLEISQTELEGFRQRAVKRKPLGSGSVKYSLSAADIAASQELVINAISYIPYINLDEEMVKKRFGEAAEVITSEDGKKHFLYPQLGLDLILDSEGKELLQYVAPQRFSRLTRPLRESIDKLQ